MWKHRKRSYAGRLLSLIGVGSFSQSGSAGSAPVADFSGTPTVFEEGGTCQFTDLSTNSPTSWLWEMNSGGGWLIFNDNSTAQNPLSQFDAATWDIRLTATNAFGSDTETKIGYLTVNAP